MKSADLLAAFVALLLVTDQLALGHLKRTAEPRPRIRVYQQIMAGLWLATVWAAGIMGPRGLWRVSLSSGMAKLLPPSPIIAIFVLISVCAIALPALLVRIPARAQGVAQALGRLSYLLPQNQRERLWWVMLSLTAGICEECIFRGFLFWYLQGPPWRFGIAIAISTACLVFAVGHLYQGPLSALGAGVVAALLFLFFLGTGNLLLPIAIHALTDMRILLLIPQSARAESSQA